MIKIISLEGFEYSGKSTQINLLKRYLKKNKIKSEFKREPGGLKNLEKIRKVLLNSNLNNQSLILFFFASRFELLSKINFQKDKLYIFDRYFDSTYAYQGNTKSDKNLIKYLIKLIKKELLPNVTFYLDINNKTLLERKKTRSFQNKFDRIYSKKFLTIKKNYNELIKTNIGNRKFIKIDANKSKDQIHTDIVNHLKLCKLI
ncbi:MAG: dTMP kinase [Pelagibacteraceae bacterium]|nr:dTMP kinase [Pelagibacteraceae bacterium]|tara:strand:+ start:1042 stop:1647 length:606 start_codon:yes stop_codon:yes gene_type:complete